MQVPLLQPDVLDPRAGKAGHRPIVLADQGGRRTGDPADGSTRFLRQLGGSYNRDVASGMIFRLTLDREWRSLLENGGCK